MAQPRDIPASRRCDMLDSPVQCCYYPTKQCMQADSVVDWFDVGTLRELFNGVSPDDAGRTYHASSVHFSFSESVD